MRISSGEMRKWWVRWRRDEGELRSVNCEAAVLEAVFSPRLWQAMKLCARTVDYTFLEDPLRSAGNRKGRRVLD